MKNHVPVVIGGAVASVAALLATASHAQTNATTPSTTRKPFDEKLFARRFKHGTVRVSGVAMHYVTGGSGSKVVVLLHGFPQTWRDWREVMPTLADKYTVIAPDLPGLGESAPPNGGYDSQTIKRYLRELVRQLGHTKIYLAAHDIAGGAGYAYAAQHPDEVQKFVIIETLVPGFEQDTTGALGRYWHPGFHMTLDLPEALVKGNEEAYLTYFFTHYAFTKTAVPPSEIKEYVRSYARPGVMHRAFEYYRAFPQSAEQNKVLARTKLTMPVLGIGGASVLADYPRKSLAAVATDVHGAVVAGSGHWIASEKPDELSRLLLDFFAEVVP